MGPAGPASAPAGAAAGAPPFEGADAAAGGSPAAGSAPTRVARVPAQAEREGSRRAAAASGANLMGAGPPSATSPDSPHWIGHPRRPLDSGSSSRAQDPRVP